MRINIKQRVWNPIYFNHIRELRRFEIIYGGAGSGKSVFLAQKKIAQHLRDSGRKTLVVRKVGATLRDSCFAELRNVLYKWKVESLFNIRTASMGIERKGSRNSIVFTGLDNVEKIKSIQGVTDIWVEEATDLTKEDIMQLNLRMRGQSPFPYQLSMTFNPISALHWIKPMFFDDGRRSGKKGDTTILKSTYLNNRFIDADYKKQIEALKEQDPIYYQIYGLGNWGVLGNMIYNNYQVRDFNQDAFSAKQIHQGLDWGFNDPSVAVRVGFKDQKIYIIDGIKIRGLTNPEFMRKSESILYKDLPIIADSSEPARIKEWQQHGWKIRACKKGDDSIKFRLDFCKRHQIIIHPTMTPFLKEIQSYIYQSDKDGNVLDTPVDFEDHYMDGFSYALEPQMRRAGLRWA